MPKYRKKIPLGIAPCLGEGGGLGGGRGDGKRMVRGDGEGMVRAGRQDPEGGNGGSIHDGDDGWSWQVVEPQSTAGIDSPWRSRRREELQVYIVADDIRGTPDGDGADVRGSHGADGELMDLSDTAGTGDQSAVAVMSI